MLGSNKHYQDIPLSCALRFVCVPFKWSRCNHLSCSTGRCSCYSYQVPLVRGRRLLLSEYKSLSEGLVTISARMGSLFLQSLCLILGFDLLVFSYSVPSPSLYYIFCQVPHMYTTKVFSASRALRHSYPTRLNMEVRREMKEQVPFGLFEI